MSTNAVTLANFAPASGYPVFRNRIINGDMAINQRAGGTITLAGSGLYGVDRWFGTEATDGTMTMQQSTVAPAGFTKSILLTTGTADASLAATQFALVGQAIEGIAVSDLGWGTANAQPVTLSFWVRSSLTGAFGGALKNSASDRSFAFSYSISAANTWEYKTVTVPGDTSGTWFNDNNIGVFVLFGLGSGSTYSGNAGAWASANYVTATGAVSVIGTAGATFYITGVQFEVGGTATPFEKRLFEQSLCERYYQRLYVVTYQYVVGAATVYAPMAYSTMRATPTASVVTANLYAGTSSVSVSGTGPSGGYIAPVASAAGYVGAYPLIALSAEF